MARGKHRRPVAPQPFWAPPPVLAYPAPPLPSPAPSVTISVLGSKNSTVARAVVTKLTKDWSGQEYVFEAAESSKREQGDVFDPVTGELLALARTFQRLSRQLFSEGSRRVKASTEAQEAARKASEEKRSKTGTPTGRTKEEWDAIQRERAEMAARHLVPPGFLAELLREADPGRK